MQEFINLKKAPSKLSVLIYFDPSKMFYININISHKFRSKIVLFHNKIKMKIEI